MNRKKSIVTTILLVVSVSLICTALAALLLSRHYRNVQFQTLGDVCRVLAEEHVSDADAIMKVLKENRENVISSESGTSANNGMPTNNGMPANHRVSADGDNLLTRYGYTAADFTGRNWQAGYWIAVFALGSGLLLFLSAFWYWHRREHRHMQELTDYLEQVNLGGQGLLLTIEEDDRSRLQDEIYKTVTTLYQTREAALAAKRNFADNLYNIAHQLKTPITAISLSAQMIEEKQDTAYAGQIRKQVARLTHLEEALLLLSRIDAGTLTLEKTDVDVWTLLTLAADNLLELSTRSGIATDIPNMGESVFSADMEWTMEAIMNLMKNCMEHSPAGSTIHTSYEQNPLYVQIRIWDEGAGFDTKDIPHLFERFYRGASAQKGGIGIGLSLSRAIIEMQGGIIRAGNLPEGGAWFEIRMYRH